MIDWIQVRKERRMRLIVVASTDVENYLLVSKLSHVMAVSIFDLPKNWIVGGVSYDHQRQGFVFVMLSPEFDPVLVGAIPETIVADRQLLVRSVEE